MLADTVGDDLIAVVVGAIGVYLIGVIDNLFNVDKIN